ncbi:MAG: hypothetical protein A2015_17555 [Spirochaetes bacterium GWF1_31_7]|nr:MAG: hypothetical protein A2Y30_05545 [Spirochaetes bacterium GWE1_32_154]OHD48629.1 MAG: hypothetical protein A2015_17555 [Spirochaetes bacterium GWF1_31_7]HBD93077.1 hypothetical protein [Spirochaetia bacterium]HBI39184.1 hypothetical protein [Spirochaetia bacterium]
MKKNLCFYIFIFLSSIVFAESIQLFEDIRLSWINDNVIVVTHNYPWESNSLIIITNKNNIVFIDTPYTNDAMEKVYTWVIGKYRPEIIETIITGYHIDNIGGLQFLKSKGIQVIGSDLTNQLIRSDGKKTILTLMGWLNEITQKKYYDYYSNAELVEVTKEIQVKDTYLYKLDNITIELFYPGESHAKDNITAYISSYNLLFGSCIIKAKESKNLGFTGDANLQNWPIAVKNIRDKYQSSKIVIPHHGQWGDIELINHTISLF